MSTFSLILFFTLLFSASCDDDSKNNKCSGAHGMGTVLFTAADVHKECWSPDEIAILTTRMILEDLLPDISVLKIDNDGYVDDLMEYCKMLVDVVRRTTKGRKKHVTLLALTDLLGGYFQHAVLPIARRAYYAGLIDFTSMEKLIQLFEELKWFLHTNGQGWSKPLKANLNFEIDAINLKLETPKGNKSCCNRLIYYEHEIAKRKCVNPLDSSEVAVHFPLPFFDTKVLPSAIAVPFRKFPVRNIESRKAAYLVMKFFVSAYQCLMDRHANRDSITKFENALMKWIEKDVIPKLKDDKFYAAFGGILRVEETLKSLGALTLPQMDTSTQACDEDDPPELPVPAPEKSNHKKTNLIVVSMLLIIFIWFIIGTAFICYRMRKNSKKSKDKDRKNLESSSSLSSGKWTIFSSSSKSKKSSCKCISVSDKSSDISATVPSSESVHKEGKTNDRSKNQDKKTKKGSSKSIKICYPPNKQPFMLDDKPAVIDAKQMMKTLSSIAEISENSSMTSKDEQPHKRKITFDNPIATKAKPRTYDPDASYILKPCSKHSGSKKKSGKTYEDEEDDVDDCFCPYSDQLAENEDLLKDLDETKDSDKDAERKGVEDASSPSTKDETFGETTSETETTAKRGQPLACHSSLTGDYENVKGTSGDKPYAFGYDFHTSSSSELSEEDTDIKTSSSKTSNIPL